MLITEGKTNWKYVLVVVILAAVVGGGILVYFGDVIKEITSFEFSKIKKLEKKVTIIINKTEYEQEETVKITVRNNLKEVIITRKNGIERKTNNESWEEISLFSPDCIWDIEAVIEEIEVGKSITFEWESVIYKCSGSTNLESGIYRLLYDYQIGNPPRESWEWKTIYSNEFTIKEKKERKSVFLTKVIQYIPMEVPDEVYEGSCWINALSTIRRDAWRCIAENSIKDPCFVFESKKSLICEPYPSTGDKGVLLKLTKPLPEPNISEDKFGEGWAWLIELEDGSMCKFVTGATVVIDGERWNFSCDKDEIVVIGDLQVGQVWKAQKAVLEYIEGEWQAKSIELTPINRVWQ